MSDYNKEQGEEFSRNEFDRIADEAAKEGAYIPELDEDEKPPVFSSWNMMYAFVIANMLLMTVLLFLITKHYQ